VCNLPHVSIVIPCRNEEDFIGPCLDSVVANDYPKDKLEVLVVDGMSQDGTREIVEEYANRYSCIRLLDSPKRITPAALSIGIARSSGEVIMRMDAHARFDREYITRRVGNRRSAPSFD
jgi:glycosyltransferase involved in cell wall biosynthesis